ncbi:hypothetical protein K470DRAFT_72356 [Piedraia hortae CBS 480.64]|uniref:Uncharacterized protein n=1 Tax=Piedraia hortae CBS 480.64 TaxID=1314780 RepID=A0A6A7BYY8_9PEZI|nr:hypothetical protein K470DRAFT_72356 [Piedraia hortae CBS 480.64]
MSLDAQTSDEDLVHKHFATEAVVERTQGYAKRKEREFLSEEMEEGSRNIKQRTPRFFRCHLKRKLKHADIPTEVSILRNILFDIVDGKMLELAHQKPQQRKYPCVSWKGVVNMRYITRIISNRRSALDFTRQLVFRRDFNRRSALDFTRQLVFRRDLYAGTHLLTIIIKG